MFQLYKLGLLGTYCVQGLPGKPSSMRTELAEITKASDIQARLSWVLPYIVVGQRAISVT